MNNTPPDLQRIYNDLKSKVIEQKEKASEELKSNFKNYVEFYEDIFTKLQKFINSGDQTEKMGGLMALDKISSVVPESHLFSFVNKFLSVTFQQFQVNFETNIHKKTAEVFGKLLRLGGTKIAQVVESDVDDALKWLTTKEYKRFTAILALNELLKETPYISFNRIFASSQSLQLIFSVIRDKRLEIRKEGLDFLNECIKQICQREQREQRDQDLFSKEGLTKIYNEVKNSINSSDNDVIHGNILMIKSLLLHAKEGIFTNQIIEIWKYILGKKDIRNSLIQIAVIETIPILAKYCKGNFILEFLNPSATYLLNYSSQSRNPKEKSLCYNTLAEIFTSLDLDSIINYIPILMKNIEDELLQRNKPMCTETIKCLESMTLKFQNKIADMVDLHRLIDSILINGLNQTSVNYLEALTKLEINKLSEHIQYKLLLVTSFILNGKIYPFEQKDKLDKNLVAKFQNMLLQQGGGAEFRSEESKCLAIQILSSFNFNAFIDCLAIFVKDIVLTYLDNPIPMIRKAAAEAGCLLYIGKQSSVGQQMISKTLMYEIIEKFLSVAISDNDVDIRQTMLKSLNENFDFYLNSPNNLRKLFLCVNDTNEKVQEYALIILTRLSKENPSDIVPFLKKTLYQYILNLSYDFQQKENERTELITLLGCLIKHGKELILPHADNIALIILQHLKNPSTPSIIIPPLLDTFGNLCVHAENRIINYLDEIIPILLQSMQDKANTKKRESSTRTLVEVIKCTGFVILPYYKYPLLLENILNLMKIEVNLELRCELLRLLGCLGAIDSFYYKKVSNKIKETNSTSKKITFDEISGYGLKYPFKFLKKKSEFQIAQNRLMQELYFYYEDLILLGNFHDQKNMFLHLANVTAQSQEKSISSALPTELPLSSLDANNRQVDSTVEELLNTPILINLNSNDYFYTITIRTLLKILYDPSLHNHHDLAIDTLKLILANLKGRSTHFLDLIIPVFKSMIGVWEVNFKDKIDNLLRLIEKIIKNCEKGFKAEFIDPVLGIFLKYVGEFRLTGICLDILSTLINFKKLHLKYKVEAIIKTLNNIFNGEHNSDHVKKTLSIYKSMEELADPYLSFIIPSLCKLITKDLNALEIEICKEVAHLLTSFASTCPSTVQYLSLMVHNLLFLLDQCQTNSVNQSGQYLSTIIMNCFVSFIYKYRNNFLVYLPLVNLSVVKYKIYHNEYSHCIEILLNYGNFEDINNLTEENEFLIPIQQRPNTQVYTVIDAEYNPPNRKMEAETIKTEFDTSHKTLKEDWIEWMRKSSVELLRQSPNPILASCHPIAEIYSHISDELYNIAFASCWSILNDKQKEFIIKHLNAAIQAQNIPTNILQTILNLAEFMQHDKEGLQIDNSTLGDLAEKCMAYAKALYYRELEFETASEKTIESLVPLYTNLGQPEAASGLLNYAKRNLSIELKMSCHENMQKWQEALDEYLMKAKNKDDDEYFVPRLRCRHALSDWETILNQCEPIMASEKHEDKEKRKKIIFMASNASMNLGQWDKLEKFIEVKQNENGLPIDDFPERNFFNIVMLIQKDKLDEANILIKKSRETLDSKVSGLLLESYGRAYENVLKLQQLFEMEEIVDIKSFKEKIMKETRSEIQMELSREFEVKKKKLKDIWEDRLNGCERNIDIWQKILSVRSLLLNKNENMDSWLKFAKLALKSNQTNLCEKTLNSLKEETNSDPKNEYDYPTRLVIANFECEYMTGTIRDQDIEEKMKEFLFDQNGKIENNLKAKCFLKLGMWAKEKIENLTQPTISKIFDYFSEATELNPENHKAWHQYALLNFEAVQFYENDYENREKHILAAVKGFVRAVSLKGKNMFQDTLRLLSLIFKFGDRQDVSTEFRDSFKIIDIISWIEVVPQIIARSDIPNSQIQSLLSQLLIHISKQHPQALIYQLTVAAKSKSHLRKISALKILEDIKSHSINLVSEAILISEELIRTSILLKEQWYEGIEEAWKNFSNDKNIDVVLKILNGLHEKMKNKPESLSEIAFHQNFGAEIASAGTWLEHYSKTKEDICLHQAFDIYYQLYRKINTKLENLKIVHLENVSPKLLQTKNCEISVPGLYKPKSPIIKIAGFQPRLPVLTSKQHPRKLCIYGSDSKEYHYLLKGHEDLRQDERVMQLFSLVNRLLNNKPETEKKDLTITTYSVIPLSTNTGLIGWVQNSDTLQQLIREYRKNNNIRNETEGNLMQTMCSKYDNLCLANKVEIFRNVLENTKGEDLQKVLWLKSPNSEIWLERRTNYTRSLATMSMVGYILGLGDRHPSNIMLQRYSGKIVHIDFGDCWEVAMKREKFPEKVPFRLTRMLVKAMEACGIEGNYRNTCELVMKVLRENKESLMAVLEAFVYDPLLNWRLLTISIENDIQTNLGKISNNPLADKKDGYQSVVGGGVNVNRIGNSLAKMGFTNRKNIFEDKLDKLKNNDMKEPSPKRKEIGREKELQQHFADEAEEKPTALLNQKAITVIDRIKKKLVGKDFKENEALKVEDQVNKLIKQATSHENICQAYMGWCPFW